MVSKEGTRVEEGLPEYLVVVLTTSHAFFFLLDQQSLY